MKTHIQCCPTSISAWSFFRCDRGGDSCRQVLRQCLSGLRTSCRRCHGNIDAVITSSTDVRCNGTSKPQLIRHYRDGKLPLRLSQLETSVLRLSRFRSQWFRCRRQIIALTNSCVVSSSCLSVQSIATQLSRKLRLRHWSLLTADHFRTACDLCLLNLNPFQLCVINSSSS